jgi:ATP-binding cassette subfamily C protein
MATPTDPASARAGGRAFLALVRKIANFAGAKGLLALVYIGLGAVFESVGLILVIPLLAVVTDHGNGQGRLQRAIAEAFGAVGATTPTRQLSLLLGGFGLLMVVRGVVVVVRDRTVNALQIGFAEHLRDEIAVALAHAGWDRVLRLRHARILNILGTDIQRLTMASHSLLQSCIALVILLAQCILSFALSPVLALFSLALLAVGAVAMFPVLRRARDMGRHINLANLSMLDSTTQFLSGLKLALSQDLQEGFLAELRSTMRDTRTHQMRYYSRQSAGRVALTTISAVVGAAVFLVGYTVLGLSAPILIAFLLVVGRMSGPAMMIQQGFQQMAQGLPAFETIEELLHEIARDVPATGPVPRRVLEGAIAFDAVTFQHPHTDEVQSHGVRAIDLVILPGSVVGIAGASGAGKTTMADLLVGLLRPQTGRIAVGALPLDDATLPSWRAQLAYVSQDPFLFHDTVRRNLLWARPDAEESDLWAALTLTGADGVVRRLDGGLDSLVGERGALLSGGERQRIALARALLRRPKLLVMDEATNAIDIDGERALLERIVGMRPRPTIVIIAHRAETLALCDRVVHMRDGRLFDDTLPPVSVVARAH